MNGARNLGVAIDRLGAEFGRAAALAPRPFAVDARTLLRREHPVDVSRTSLARGVSRNGRCRLLAARDGWLAVNLARAEDIEAVPALLGEVGEGGWAQLARALPARAAAEVVAQGALLGLAVALPGETQEPAPVASAAPGRAWRGAARVLDLSALWAGPLCGALLAAAGADVLRLESATRPDPTATVQPRLYARLNGAKRHGVLDLATAAGRAALAAAIVRADVIITSARARGLRALGWIPSGWSHAIHVAITAHGLAGAGAGRIGFGDDCAVAGGLLDRDRDGRPAFVGDAIADPLTGIRAASLALGALSRGECGTLDVSLAATSALVARLRREAA